jgi:FkbM family methyltransferase
MAKRKTSLLHKAQTAYRRAIGLPDPIVQEKLAGRLLHVREGGVRDTDHDDAWLLACARHAETIFDVGCNMGQAALIMLLAENVRHIVCVDPNPAALTLAAENLILNRLSHKARFACFFADEADEQQIEFWTSGAGAAGSMYIEQADTARRRGQSMPVPTITLDTLAKQVGLTPDFLKVDVEGAELRTLRGAAEIIGAGKTRVMIEMHMVPGLTMRQHCQQMTEWAAELGCATWYMRTHQPITEADIPDKRTYLLLQPQSWAYPDWLQAIPYKSALEAALTP